MTDKPERKRWAWDRWTLIGAPLLLLYLLSIGPAARMAVSGSSADWYYMKFCWPLHQLARLELPGRILARYTNLWLPKGKAAAAQSREDGLRLIYFQRGAMRMKRPQ